MSVGEIVAAVSALYFALTCVLLTQFFMQRPVVWFTVQFIRF